MERLSSLRRHLDQNLFPTAPRSESTLGRGELAILGAAGLVLAVVLQIARLGWEGSLNALWAEDGSIFLQDALTRSFSDAVFSEYAGYLVLVPRLIGEAASLAPLSEAPAVVAILSGLVIGLSGLAVWSASAGHIASPGLRIVLATFTVLVPVSGLEPIVSASNVSWYMLFATFWLLLWRPRTQLGASLGAIFIAATALSNPGVWFFLPLAALRLLAARDRRDWTILGAYFAGAAVQLVAVAASSYVAVEPVWSADIWAVLLQRVTTGAALGLRIGGGAWEQLGWALLIAVAAGWIAAFAIGLRSSSAGTRWLAAIALPTALVMFVLSVYQRAVGTPMLWPADAYIGNAGRYAIVPALLLVSVALTMVSSPGRPAGRNRRRLGWALAGLMLVSTVGSFYAGDTAVRGTPPWKASVDAAEATCAGGRPASVAIPISPPPFGMMLPCSTVSDTSDPGAQR